MAQADARVGSLNLRGTAGTTINLTLTWPTGTALGATVVTVGETEYVATVTDNVAAVAIDVPSGAPRSVPLTVTVDGALRTTGSLRTSAHGTDSPDTSVTVIVETVDVAVSTNASVSLVEDPPGSGLYELVVA